MTIFVRTHTDHRISLRRPAAMLCWHALLRAALLASAVLRAGSKPALRGGHGPRTGCCRRNNSTGYACMCMCNAMNSSLGRYVDKHFVKEWARTRAADVPFAETVAYVDATTLSTFFDASLIANAGRQLIFKSTHLCGGVMAVTPDAVTCLRSPCYAADPAASGAHKSRHAAFFVGRLATGSIDATMAVLRRTCAGWLGVRYRGVMGIEGRLYREVHRGCMLEAAIDTDAADVTDIKVFCFAGRCAFAMVSSKRFASSTNASAGAALQKIDTRGFFTTPGWKRLRTVQIKEDHPYLASWTAPPFAARLLAHAEALAQGFGNVRVDFLHRRTPPIRSSDDLTSDGAGVGACARTVAECAPCLQRREAVLLQRAHLRALWLRRRLVRAAGPRESLRRSRDRRLLRERRGSRGAAVTDRHRV